MEFTFDVYLNLTIGGYSMKVYQASPGLEHLKGRVVAHTNSIWLGPEGQSCELRVNQAVRQRVKSTGHREVHAVVRGKIRPKNGVRKYEPDIPVTYNPYKYKHFIRLDTQEYIGAADEVWLKPGGQMLIIPLGLSDLYRI